MLARNKEPRFATPADDAELRRLAREIPMAGPLTYTLEREPDFFAFARLQGDEPYTGVIDAPDGGIAAMGTGIISARRIGGAVRRVAYAGDLKVAPAWRQQGLAASLAQFAAREAPRHQVDLIYGLVLGGNRAMEAMIARSPPAWRIRRLATVRSHSFFLGGKAAPAGGVRRASAGDLDQMSALWREVHARRDLAPADLPRRLPIEEFLVVERAGRIAAFAAAWDPSGVRQVRVLAARGLLSAMRALYNPLAALLGRPRMPRDGELLRSIYLTHLCAESPGDLRALLAHARTQAKGQLLLEVALDLKDPLAPAAQAGFATRVDYNVVELSREGVPSPSCDQPVYLDLALA